MRGTTMYLPCRLHHPWSRWICGRRDDIIISHTTFILLLPYIFWRINEYPPDVAKTYVVLYVSIFLADHPNTFGKLLCYLHRVLFQICWWHWVTVLGGKSSRCRYPGGLRFKNIEPCGPIVFFCRCKVPGAGGMLCP